MYGNMAYSLHVGSNKNRKNSSRRTAKNNLSQTTSKSNNGIQSAQQLSKVDKHNYRKYDNDIQNRIVLKGTDSAYEDVKEFYKNYFEEARIEYNNKQTRSDRKIDDYFEYISNDLKKDLACELIIEIGDKEFWDNQDMKTKERMYNVYKEQIKDLEKLLPNFKTTSAVLHLDETSPHIHIVGVPVKEKNKYGMSKQVGKSDVFTRESLAKLQDQMRELAIIEFNTEYKTNYKLKEKQKGRNEDINVKDMKNYKHLKTHKELEQAVVDTNLTDQKNVNKGLDEIEDIIDNLDYNNGNYNLTSKDKEKIERFIKDTKYFMKHNEEVMEDLINHDTLINKVDLLETEVDNLSYDKDKWIDKYHKLEKENKDYKNTIDFLDGIVDRDKINLMKFLSTKINTGTSIEKATYKEVAKDLRRNKIFKSSEYQLCLKPIFDFNNHDIQQAIKNIEYENNKAVEEFDKLFTKSENENNEFII